MCMKYVNANLNLYEGVTMDPSGTPLAFNKPFNGIVPTLNEDGHYSIGNFIVVTQISLLGTNTGKNQCNNIVHKKGCLNVIIRMTKCDPDESKRLATDLDSFDIDLKKMDDKISHACYPFLNYTRITDTKKINLEAGTGDYVIKVLVKEAEKDEYSIQTMCQLKVGKQ